MIPVSSKESIEYTDSDKVVWTFKPKTGTLEKEMFVFYKKNAAEGVDTLERLNNTDEFIEKILISPKGDYNNETQNEIIKYWNQANALTVEEKKS
ncbi:MAG: hypothetical protein IMZ53_01910 [Thermoplasmata archaeon]|nr:hypothetical protein [Thermoplasmata archaeon]